VAMFGVNSRIPLDVIFPIPKSASVKWPEYVEELKKRLEKIYTFMRRQGNVAIQRATAYQSGRVRNATSVRVGDIVYYFSPRVTQDAAAKNSKKLALLWTGPYEVKEKISETLVKIYPLGEWAKRPKEMVTVIDKLRVIKVPLTEAQLRPQEQVDLDELEEELEDF